MSAWTDQEIINFAKKLADHTELGSRGDIVNILKDISDKMDALSGVQTTLQRTQRQQQQQQSLLQRMMNRGAGQHPDSSNNRRPGGQDQSRDEAKKDLQTSVLVGLGKFASRLKNATLNAEGFGAALAGFVGGATLTKFGAWLDDSTDSLRKTYAVGQTFSGSILQMNIAAGQAGLPLKDFADLIVANSSRLAALGGPQGFAGLQKNVRTSMAEFGAYGLKTEEVNELLGDYLDTMTVYGAMDDNMRQRAAQSFQNLVAETTAMAALTGRNRKDMMKQMAEASKNVHFQSKLFELPAAKAQQMKENLDKLNQVFTAFGQETGQFFSQLMSESASGMTGAFSDMGQELVAAGLGHLVPAFDKLGQKVAEGSATQADAALAVGEFMEGVKGNLSALRAQARAGNQEAAKMLQRYGEFNQQLGKYGGDMGAFIADMKKKEAEQKKVNDAMAPFTKMLMNFRDGMQRITGAFKGAFFTSIQRVATKFDAMFDGNSAFMNTLTKKAEELGTFFGGLINDLFPDGAINNLEAGVDGIIGGIKNLANFFFKVVIPFVQTVSPWVGSLVEVLTKVIPVVVNAFKWIHDKIQGMIEFFGGSENTSKEWSGAIMAGMMLFAPTIGKLALVGFKKILLTLMNAAGNAASGAITGRGSGFAGRLGKGLGKAGRMLGNGGVGGLAAAGVGMAFDALAPEDMMGKDTVSSMLEYGGIGATLGSFIPGVGTAIGAGVGAAIGAVVANWDDVKSSIVSAWNSVSETFSGMWDWFKNVDLFGALKSLFNISPLGMLLGGWEGVKTGITGVFGSIGDVFTNVFGWLGNLDVKGMVRDAISAIPLPFGVGDKIISLFDSMAPQTTSKPATPTAPVAAPPPVTPTQTVTETGNLPQQQQSSGANAEDLMKAMVDNMTEMRRILTEVNKNIIVLRDYLN